MFLRSIERRVRRAILRRPVAVVAAAGVLCVVAAALAFQVEFRTSRSELAPADDPEQRRFTALLDDFDGSQALVACVEATDDDDRPDPEAYREFVRGLARALRARPEVRSVFHRVDVDWALRRAFHLAPPDRVDAVARFVTSIPDEDLARIERDGVAGAVASLAARMARESSVGAARADADAVAGVRGLDAFLAWLDGWIRKPDAAVASLDGSSVFDLAAPEAPTGDVTTRDGRVWFAFVSPSSGEDSLAAFRSLVGAAREVAASRTAADPRFRVSWTGNPAMTVEEMDAVRRDTWRTGAFAALGVLILTLLVFRWKSHALLVLASLAVGILLALGAVRLEYGYLNLITSAFLSTLIGVGIAYGIHPMSEYELEGAHTRDPGVAVDLAWHRTGAAVATSAVTTAVAFFSILLMRFRGFAELGLVAGVGVLLCLASFLALLPAMLVLYGRRRARRDRAPREGRAAAHVDRLWLERAAGRVCRFPRSVVVGATALTIASAAAIPGIGFDVNLLELLPDAAESVRYQKRMAGDANVSPLFTVVVADDVASLRALRERAAAEPTVAAFQSVLEFLPADPDASARAVASAREALARLPAPEGGDAALPARLRESVAGLERALLDASDAAFGAGLGELAGALEGARARAESIVAALDAQGPEAAARLVASERDLARWWRGALGDLRVAASLPAPTVASLPDDVRDRFTSRSGKLLGLLQPAGQVFDPAFLDDYVAASRRVSAEATGFPIVFHHMSKRITEGFRRAVAAGAVLVFVVLLIDYRDVRAAGLALVPLGIGVVWMLGAMRLLGLSFNFANLVAVPLILGVGIDNGVHVVHRLRLEGQAGMTVVLRHTGRAILIASMTTMIGFGSLALASHRGLASLGVVLLVGVGACLVTSVIVLPNLLVAVGAYRE